MATATEPRARSQPSFALALAWAFPWFIAFCYLALVVLRFLAYDQDRLLAFCNSQTLWIFLPAYLLASAAWCFRRYALAIVATIAVVFHVAMVVPSIGTAEPIPAAARAAPHLRVITANVRWTNPTRAPLAREILAADADVILFQEITQGWVETLRDAGFEQRYRYRIIEPFENPVGEAVYSRYPLRDVVIVEQAFKPVIAADVDIGPRTVSLVDVHLTGPTRGMRLHRRSVAILHELIRTREHPRIVAGDFNSTPYNRTMHRMEDLGLRSAHELRGRGLAVTWPNGKHLFPPVRLDHVLVDPTLVVLSVRELRGTGSDHKPVVADIALP